MTKPTTSPLFYVRSTPSIIVAAILLFIGAAIGSCKGLQQAAPMSGTCVDIPMKRYVGEDDKDGKRCTWRGQVYWCLYDPNKELWSCDFVEEVPAEKK